MKREGEIKQVKTFRGVVVSGKMQGTAVVLVERYVRHAKYGKYIRRRKRFAAHNPENRHREGDLVVIEETRPISKTKRFKITGKAS